MYLLFEDGGGTASTIGGIRFPQPVNGVNNGYTAIAARSAIGQSVARDLKVVQLWENPADWLSMQIGDPENYYTVLTGGKNGYAAISTDTASGSVAGCYFLCRSDGLAALNLNVNLGNPVFEVSDSMASDYAWRLEVKYNGYVIERSAATVTCHEFRSDNTSGLVGFGVPVGGCDAHNQLLFGSQVAQASTPFRERRGTKTISANYTLADAEIPCRILEISGSLGGSTNIIAPTSNGACYFLSNKTNQSLVIKTVAGTGVTIATGKGAEVYCDGTNYVRRTADV